MPRAVGPRGTFDLTKPLTLSAYGQWTKKAGFYELAGGQMKELVYEDASFSTPVKAMKADRFLFTRQTFVEFPDLRVSGPGFADVEEDHRRQPAAEGLPVGPPRPVRLQEQGRRAAAGHPRDSRRLQAGREAADDRDLLREELAEHARLHAAGLHGQHGPDAHAGGQRRLSHDDAGRPLPHRLVAQRHAGVRRGGHAQGDRDGLRRPEAHRRHRAQLRRRGRRLHRDDVEDVRGRRHGRGRRRSLQRLQR